MADSSGDEELVLERVNSGKVTPKFTVVPKDVEFTFKFKNTSGRSYCLIQYSLTEGRKLPYITIIKDRLAKFSETLEPSFDNMQLITGMGDNNLYVFQDLVSSVPPQASAVPTPASTVPTPASAVPTPASDVQPQVITQTKENHKDQELFPVVTLETLLVSLKDDDRLAPYGCFLCQNKFATLEHCVAHVETAHSDWQQAGAKLVKLPDLRLDSSSVVSGVYESGPGSSLQSMNFESGASSWQTELLSSKEDCVQKVGGESPRSNRSWFADLEASFLENVIGKCSQKVKAAVAEDLDIASLEERRVVSREILDETLHAMHRVFGSENPRKKNAAKVAGLLATIYPAMFKCEEKDSLEETPSKAGYGLGGIKGLKNLPLTICQRYHDKFLRSKRSVLVSDDEEEAQEMEEEVPRKKGRSRLIYGVNQKKWYATKVPASSIDALKQAGKVQQFQEREELFNQNRPGLMKLIKDSTSSVSKFLDGFFQDPRHLQFQFQYATDCSISEQIRKSLVGHLENLEEYLLFVNSSEEFMEKYDKVVQDCTLEFDGGLIHKYIYILRWAGEDFDGGESALFRLEGDGVPKSASPHIYAARVGKLYNFELWVEGARILHNMDLAEAVSAFLHLSFTFNLKYPQKSEFLCDFLQREVAEYGDSDGTRTSKAKSTAENKLARYYMKLGKAMGAKNVKK